MEIKSFKKKNGNIYEIIFTDNTKLELYDDVIIKYNLLINKTITEKSLKEILSVNQKIAAYMKAIKYLNFKLRTPKEIERYLTKNNYEEDTIKETIARLKKEKYLDDEIYIKSFINDQINLTLKGPQKIRQELLKLGFKDTQFMPYLDSFTADIWHEKIKKIIAKRIKSNHNLSTKVLKEKTKQYLVKEGYWLNQIIDIIDYYDFPIDNDILKKEFNKEYVKLKKKYEGIELRSKIKTNLYRKGFNLAQIDTLLTDINTND